MPRPSTTTKLSLAALANNRLKKKADSFDCLRWLSAAPVLTILNAYILRIPRLFDREPSRSYFNNLKIYWDKNVIVINHVIDIVAISQVLNPILVLRDWLRVFHQDVHVSTFVSFVTLW